MPQRPPEPAAPKPPSSRTLPFSGSPPASSPGRAQQAGGATSSGPQPKQISGAPKAVVTPAARRLTPEQSINSNIRKILLTSPTFPRLYADVILHCAPNSREANILRPHYQTICERVNLMSNQKGKKERALISKSPESAAAPQLSKASNSVTSIRTSTAACANPNRAVFTPSP